MKNEKEKPELPGYCKLDIPFEFQGKDKKELVKHIKKLYRHSQYLLIPTYWHIGNNILGVYKKKYGESVLEKIANDTQIEIGSLRKACNFAQKYEEEQMIEVVTIKKKFILSWRMIALNLTLDPEELIQIYNDSDTKADFYKITEKLRDQKKKKNTEEDDDTEDEADDSDIDEDDDGNEDEDTEEDVTDDSDIDEGEREKKRTGEPSSPMTGSCFGDKYEYTFSPGKNSVVLTVGKGQPKPDQESVIDVFNNIIKKLGMKHYKVSVVKSKKK